MIRGTLALLLTVICLAPVAAHAVPSLGVATNNAYSDGVGGTALQPYQAFFANPDVSVANGGNEGFLIGPSGDNLIVYTNILNSFHIWLLTDTTTFNTNDPITFNGLTFGLVSSTGQFDGYKPTPYYGVDLGPVFGLGNVLNAGWTPLPANPFQPEPFYARSAPLTYSGQLQFGTYFFAVADTNGCVDLQANSSTGCGKDPFSPKTTSATAVPEPATLLLVGSALVGLAAVRRWSKP